jgi:AraC-like DNA-binding protein
MQSTARSQHPQHRITKRKRPPGDVRDQPLVGEPAVRYVTRLKMHAALMWLKEENAAPSEIASRLGYESEAAFSRAFKRLVGISPGAARRREPRALHNAAVSPKR